MSSRLPKVQTERKRNDDLTYHERRHPSWKFRTRLLVSALQNAAQRVTCLSPQKARASLDLLARFTPPTLGIRREHTVVGGIPGEWFIPSRWTDAGVTFMHLHGGGYALCSSITHRMMISDIARAARARGLGIDYRLAPEHPYPAALDDCESAYHGLLRRGIEPDRLIITGDSAGGALVLAVLIKLRDQGLPLPRAAVVLSPWVDLECRGETIVDNATFDYIQINFMRYFADLYLDGEERTNHFASPVNAQLTGLPPLLIQAGGAEVLLSDIERLAERAREAGVEVTLQIWEGMVHAFQGFTLFIPEAREAVQAIGRFIRQSTSDQVPPHALPPRDS